MAHRLLVPAGIISLFSGYYSNQFNWLLLLPQSELELLPEKASDGGTNCYVTDEQFSRCGTMLLKPD